VSDVDDSLPAGAGEIPWFAWKRADDGRKIPRAPWTTGGDQFVSAQDPDVWTDLATARKWCEHLPGFDLATTIRDRDQFPDEDRVLIDFDDARDPETGRWHPVARELIATAESYAQVSTSGTGGHILCRGSLPDDVKSIDAPLPHDEEFPDAGVEVYDSARFIAMTGRHVEGTPVEMRDCQALIDDLADEYATVPEGTPDELTQEPRKTRGEIADVETTAEIQDVFDAIQHTGPSDVRLRSTVTHERGDGSKSLDPSWANSSSGTRLAQVDDGWVYRQGMRGLDALQVVALEERIVASEDEYPSGAAFWQAVEALRERGAHIPEFDGSESTEDVKHVAVLPESPRARAAANGWDWQSADRTDTTVTIDDARERTFEAIADAYEAGDHALVEALPTMGKSFGAIAAAAESGVPITILTGRGNQEQYQQFQQWCTEHGLRAKILPSVWRDCETFQGEHGEAIEATVKDWYRRGATGKDIHKDAEYELGEPLSCEGPAGRRCSYKIGWEFDAEEYDVLIGNYLHAHVDSAMQGRVPVFDEFPGDAFETSLDQWLAGAVSQFVQSHDDLPFDDHADLVEHRRDEQRRADALAWFDDHAPEREGRLAFASSDGHAAAPLATYTILAGTTKDLGNGWERASLPGFDGGVGLYDRESGRVHLHTPPSYRYTRGVVALDGTPSPRLWEIAIGSRLNHRSVLSDGERSEYLRDTLGLNIIRTTDAVKPYSGTADHVAVSQDRALIEAISDEHGQNPSLLTTKTAKGVYREEGVLDDVRDAGHYGDLKGSNRRENTRLGAVIGSRNFGDRFVEKWGALAGEAVGEPDRSDPEKRGANLSFGGGVGDDVLQHMREHETLQAVMRFGRDGRGATVYVHTNTLPGWVEDVLAGEGQVIGTWSDGMRQVLDTVRDRCEWTTREIAEHPAVEIGTRQVRDHLHTLVERGSVDREIEGNGFVWRDDGLHRVGEHGDVELAPADHDDLGEGERCEVSRSSIYTWEFRSPPGSSTGSDSVTTDHGTHPTTTAPDHPDPPPDEAD